MNRQKRVTKTVERFQPLGMVMFGNRDQKVSEKFHLFAQRENGQIAIINDKSDGELRFNVPKFAQSISDEIRTIQDYHDYIKSISDYESFENQVVLKSIKERYCADNIDFFTHYVS